MKKTRLIDGFSKVRKLVTVETSKPVQLEVPMPRKQIPSEVTEYRLDPLEWFANIVTVILLICMVAMFFWAI